MADLSAAVRDLAPSFAGRLLLPEDPAWEMARHVQNGMIDRRPAIIAQCRGTADIVDAIRLGREHGLEIAVRGGGHNVGGRGTVDGGLLIDLSLMRSVRVDTKAKTVYVAGGSLWGDVNRETQVYGLATTGGVVSTTGVAGLTLGGGLGWLMPKYGLALDNLLGADVVLADGTVVSASESEHPDLFWGLRGGGGNFGVVSSFVFRLHPVGPTVTGGLIAWPFERAKDVLRMFRQLAANATDDVMLVSGLLTAPDGQTKLAAMAGGFFGSAEDADAFFKPLKSLGPPAMDALGPIPYARLNTLLDDAFPKGARNYWKAHFVPELPDGLIDVLVDAYTSSPSPMSQLLLEHFHGAPSRVPLDATPFSLRSPGFNCGVFGLWKDPAEDQRLMNWCRGTYAAIQPYAGPSRYLNYLDGDEIGDPVLAAAYGPNVARLRQVKAQYDPDNVFHINVNITPRA